MIVPSERSKHIILICKGHHECENARIALYQFLSRRYGLDIKQVSGSDVYNSLLDTMKEVLTTDELIKFIKDIFYWKDSVHYNDVIEQMISRIAWIKVKENDEILVDLAV